MQSRLSIESMTCNYLTNPLGLDSLPRFSWKSTSPVRGQHQTAYRIRVSTAKDNAVAWDSGVRRTSDCVLISYEGDALMPRTRYTWQVTAYDSEDKPSISDLAWFETGKLSERWAANWIGVPGMDIEKEETVLAAPLFRTVFDLPDAPVEARLYISGLGLYEAYVNGEKPTDNVLLQNFTRYDTTVFYNTYDVTAALRKGANALGMMLGNGWYNCVASDPWYTKQATWRHIPKLICELHIQLADGSEQVVLSKPAWRTHTGPITYNCIRSAEYYDARLEIPGWNMPGFDDSDWSDTQVVRSPGGKLVAEEMQPVRSFSEHVAVKKAKVESGAWVLDVGQNMAGVARIKLRGKQGTEFQFYFNDERMPDGSLPRYGGFMDKNEYQTAKYIKKSDDEEVYQPRFIYYGFQYVELVGLDYEPELSDVTALFQHTELGRRGQFACSSDTLNSIVRIADWATLSNYVWLPTDCPHREKNGWIGDSAVSSEQTILSYAPMAGYTKWMHDFLDCQKPNGALPCVVPSTGWGYGMWNGPDYSSTLFNIPWFMYLYCGDKDILAECYEGMKKQVSFMEEMSDDFVTCYGGGDWCAPFEGPAWFENMASYKAPKALTDTAYFHSNTRTLAKIAGILGLEEDRKHYNALADEIKASFRRHFFDEKTKTVASDCQTSTACMLYHGLCEPDEKLAVLDQLLQEIREKDGHLDFGIFGCKAVMQTLGAENRADVGYAMANKTTYPSWGHWLEMGANTLWECWNGQGSHNHHMFSDVIAFFYKYLAGINPDEQEPGFRHIILRPAVNCGLSWAKGSHETMLGTVRCAWENQNGRIKVNVAVPVGAYASLHLPLDCSGRITESGKPPEESFGVASQTDNDVVLSLTSGEYQFDIA